MLNPTNLIKRLGISEDGILLLDGRLPIIMIKSSRKFKYKNMKSYYENIKKVKNDKDMQ